MDLRQTQNKAPSAKPPQNEVNLVNLSICSHINVKLVSFIQPVFTVYYETGIY